MARDSVRPERQELGSLLRSVVKVLTVSDAPDYEQPWQTQGASSSSGSGAVVATSRGLRVLTNAHCVENHVFVEVRRYGKARKFVADVEAIGHECDLALLTVEDEAFFQGADPIPLGPLPHLSDRVSVCGYPIGGERLSITQGIVSRIELVHYAQSQRRLLAVQIDAAINSGNSGGPVVRRGKLAGVAFQALDGATRVGHMIASPVVEHFLKDVEDGVYDGFPGLGVVAQALESSAHRRCLGLPAELDGGVLVTRVVFESSAWGVVEEGDVLLSVDGVSIARDGTVPLRDGELIDLAYVVGRRQVGEDLALSVFRAGEVRELVLRLREPRHLVPENRYDAPPTYYVYGGLLLVPLSRDYLETWGEHFALTAPRHLMAIYEHDVRAPDRVEVVVLQKVLADRVNQGYHDIESAIVERAQGATVRSLRHLIDLLEAAEAPFVQLRLADGRHVVLDREEVEARSASILRRFGVPEDRSDDLRESLASPASVADQKLGQS